FLYAGGTGADRRARRPAAGRRHGGGRGDGDRPSVARDAAHRRSAAAAGHRLCAGRRGPADYPGGGRQGAAAARRRRARPRPARPALPHHHREFLRRRPGGHRYHGGGAVGAARRAGGNRRAVSDPARVHPAHAAWPAAHRAGLPASQSRRAAGLCRHAGEPVRGAGGRVTAERTMLSFVVGTNRFNYRVAGIALRDGHVLVCREDDDDWVMLPGGRVEMGEPTTTALVREIAEELHSTAEIGALVFTVENFFVR